MLKLILFFSVLLCITTSLHATTPLGIEECTALARQQALSVRLAKNDLAAAQARKSEAFTRWFPQVNAQAMAFRMADYAVNIDNAGGNLPVYDGNPANLPQASQFAYLPASSIQMMDRMGVVALSVMQPIYAGGRIHAGNRLAALGVDVSRLQLIQAEKEAVEAVMIRYYNLAALQATRETLLGQKALLDTLHREVISAYRQGLVTSRDTLDLAYHRLSVEKYLQDLESGTRLAGDDLCHALGMPCAEPLALTDTLGPLREPGALRVEHALVGNQREERQLLEKAVSASELQGDMERGALRPQLLVGASLFATSDFSGGHAQNAAVFAGVNVPLTGFWEGAYNTHRNRAAQEQAQIRLQDTESLLILQMDKSWNELEAAWRSHALSRIRLEQRGVALTDARLRFAQGLDKASELVEIQAQLQTAAEAEITARRDYLSAVATYLRVTGRFPDAR